MRSQGILLPPWPAVVSLRILGNRFLVEGLRPSNSPTRALAGTLSPGP